MSEPLPSREIARGCAIALGILLVLASPVVFLLGLELLPRHGDGMGVIGAATELAVVVALLGLALAVAVALTPRRRRPGPSEPEDRDG